MTLIVFSVAAVVLFFLGKVGFIIYQVMSMDFDFNRPWYEGIASTDHTEESEEPTTEAYAPRQKKTEMLGDVSVTWL